MASRNASFNEGVVAEALLVMLFFMHLKYDTKTYSLFLLFPLFMAVLLAAVVLVAAAGI